MPSVVSIETKQKVVTPGFRHPFARDPFFRQFFQFDFEQPDRESINQGLGSGFIVDSSGLIMTNNHVIKGADEIVVRFEDGREAPAKVLGTDERIDIAVLKVEGAGPFTPVPLGNSDELKVGMIVLAMGTPFSPNLSQSVTMGIISALSRSGIALPASGPLIQNFIQTDAAINSGNSGGPLVNLDGEVIGVNVAIVTGGGRGSDGVGFAIPINSARHVLESIVSHGKIVRGWLGVGLQDITDDLRQTLGLESTRGAAVTEVIEKSPAAAADFRVGDVIVKWNGVEVRNRSNLTDMVMRTNIGTSATVEIIRSGKAMTLTVTVGERPASADSPTADGSAEEVPGSALKKLGITVKPVQGEEARQLGLPADGCLLVTDVASSSPLAGRVGPGMGIIQVDGKNMRTVADLESAVSASGRRLILLRHQGRNLFITLTIVP
jgi:Do/DeqQ family serine protease